MLCNYGVIQVGFRASILDNGSYHNVLHTGYAIKDKKRILFSILIIKFVFIHQYPGKSKVAPTNETLRPLLNIFLSDAPTQEYCCAHITVFFRWLYVAYFEYFPHYKTLVIFLTYQTTNMEYKTERNSDVYLIN